METTSPGKYNWKPSLLEHCGEVAVLLGETHFNGRGQESDPWIVPRPHPLRGKKGSGEFGPFSWFGRLSARAPPLLY